MYLLRSNPNNLSLTSARPVKKTRTIKEVFGAMRGKNKVVATTPLQQVSTSFSRKKEITFSISNAFIVEEKIITPTSVIKTRKRSQKTGISLDNLYAGKYS